MAGRKTDYHKHATLNVMRGTNLTAFTPYLGMLSAAPDDSHAGTELSGGGYSRKAITFGAPSGGAMTNSADVVFDAATGDWLPIAGAGIYDASSGGNLRYWQDYAPDTTTVSNGQTLTVAAGDITVSDDLD